jgi:hypothetical protein
VRLEGLGKLKKNHLIGYRTRDLPVCSIVSPYCCSTEYFDNVATNQDFVYSHGAHSMGLVKLNQEFVFQKRYIGNCLSR